MREVGRRLAARTGRLPALLAVAALIGAGLAGHAATPAGHVLATDGTIIVQN